jgi:acrylyl-CoA reductase (NADPH)
MAIGTAGFTAMLAVIALERGGVSKDKGEILVTGRHGRRRELRGVAACGPRLSRRRLDRKVKEAEYLKSMGAAEIIDPRHAHAAGQAACRRSAGPGSSTRSAVTRW